MNMLNIGLFGGTFDPIHKGHIDPIKQAAKQLALDTIHIIPANIPPHKSQTNTNSFHRSEMVKTVCQYEPLFTFDGRELNRDKPSYTVDSLHEVVQELKEKQQITHVYFFMGMDSLNTFTSWHQWQNILAMCHLVVMPRPGYLLDKTLPPVLLNRVIDCAEHTSESIHQHINIKKSSYDDTEMNLNNIFIMQDIAANISSTEIRAALAQPQHAESKIMLETMLPKKIYQYITQHQLY